MRLAEPHQARTLGVARDAALERHFAQFVGRRAGKVASSRVLKMTELL